ncbi:sulfate permease [Halieaceae bacterium IMCC8485]|uniref:Sulfate permease n=1 Tax=Candidatus Seongchinamella marina TaxID=2518990 RepID=A0ABT3SZT6_9GAMM|nr:sulfate permease [Candidatus Seongchinamella marina]MCX2975522.1 sulfate permease [Candidatus Seongchinamella marina]
MQLEKVFPILRTTRGYNRETLSADLLAALIVTIMLIPQSLAYSLLAGLPAEVGLYASILPLIVYALFGTSRTLAVGPVAVASLMTASALANFAQQGTAEYLAGAIILALLSGLFLLLLGLLRLGVLANLLSHPVVSGFITASGMLIAFSQLKHALGVDVHGQTLFEMGQTLVAGWEHSNGYTIVISVFVLAFLIWSRTSAAAFLARFHISHHRAQLIAKASPIVGVLITIAITVLLDLDTKGVAVVGSVPSGLPTFQFPTLTFDLVEQLYLPAIMISIIGYIESVSVGKTLAAKRRQRIDVNQELVGLGAANVASAISGAFPVTGGFSRSVVNFDAGASTQLASVFCATGIALVSIFLTPSLHYLPKATLAATIIVAVLSLVDFSILKRTWQFSKSDFAAVLITIVVTLLFGVETGVACGVLVSVALHLARTSMPHIAEVGLIEGTEHFRNIRRHLTLTTPEILSLRMDESLFFANAHHLESRIYDAVFQKDRIAHVILLCSALNEIDASALEVLEGINAQLAEQGVQLHFSEIKGPVMDTLKRAGFLSQISGNVFLTHYEAYKEVRKLI